MSDTISPESSTTAELASVAGLLSEAAAALARLAGRRSRPAPVPVAAPAPSAALPAYLTTKQAAALLGVHHKTLEALRANGAGPAFVRVGKAVRYLASDLVGMSK